MIELKRDCDGLMIPVAAPISIPAKSLVSIIQNLGGYFTVNYNGNLVRIEGKDADALGVECVGGSETKSKVANGPVDMEQVWQQLKTCYDPEIPVNIVDLGLIYDCRCTAMENPLRNRIDIQMTLTAPGCGMGPIIAQDAEAKVREVENVTDVQVELVFDPPWGRERMSEAAQLELGLL